MKHVLAIAALGVALLSGCGEAESDADPIDASSDTGATGGVGGSTGGVGGSTGGVGGSGGTVSTGGAGGSAGGSTDGSAGGSTDGSAGNGGNAGSGGSAGASDAAAPCPQAPVGPDASCASVSQSLIGTAPCVFAIPSAPGGSTLDPNLTNVMITSGSAPPQMLGNVCTEADCATHTNGWYFDHNAAPTQIVLCADACALVDPNGAVQGLLGCGTITAAPK